LWRRVFKYVDKLISSASYEIEGQLLKHFFWTGSGGSSGGGNRNNGGNFGGNFGGNQNNGGNSGGNCQVDCKKSSCTVSDGRGTLGSCFLPPFPTKCSGLPSGCGSCVNQCSKKWEKDW